MTEDVREHLDTLRRTASLTSRLALLVRGELASLSARHHGTEWIGQVEAAAEKLDRAIEHLVEVPSFLERD